MNKVKKIEFLKSVLAKEGKYIATGKVVEWLKIQNEKVSVNIKQISFDKLSKWYYSDENGILKHETNKFFTIEGIKVSTNWGLVSSWQQPIINQPEIGYLGFIAKHIDGVLHFLLQAKIEPGNVNYVQLSPTLQATRSNYMQVHKGKAPLYLEYFRKAKPSQILVDQLQSEQGARFLRKRNRNIIIFIEDEIPVQDNFVWLTLAQIKELMAQNNLVNMDTRTVVSGISYGDYDEDVADLFCGIQENTRQSAIHYSFLKSALVSNKSFHTIDHITAFLTKYKSQYELEVERVPLKKLENWVINEQEIQHEENKYFKVIAVDVEIGNREVVKWSQPMVQPMQDGLCAFVCKEINGMLHFAVQAKLECGNHDIIEFAPTIQCLTGNYKDTKAGALPFLDYVLNAPPNKIIFDTLQSEEGGRFYKEQNRNIIVMADDNFSNNLPEHFIWMTLNQMFIFLKFNNFFNIQARSLIAAIRFS